jgi:hypothetical protein
VIDTHVVELLEFNTKRWWSVAVLPQSKQGFASMPMGDCVVVVGGFWQERLALDTVHSFTFGSSEWQTLPPLTTPRCYPAAVSVTTTTTTTTLENEPPEAMAVVLGGRNASFQEMKSVECYKHDDGDDGGGASWQVMPSFSTPRMAPAAVVLPEDVTSRPRIILVGGYDGTEWTTSLEVLEVTDAVMGQADDDDGQWSSNTFPSMPIPVSFPQAVLIPNGPISDGDEAQQPAAIFVVGTSVLYDMDEDTFTIIQSYNFKTKAWSILLSTPKGRNNVPKEGCSIAFYKNIVYAIGGKEVDKRQPQKTSKPESKKVLQWKIENPANQLLQDGMFDTASSHVATRSVTSRHHRKKSSNNSQGGSHHSGAEEGSLQKNFIERSDRSRNVPPAINVQNNANSSIADLESLYSNYNDHQSVKSAVSQMPTRSPEEEIATRRSENLPYMDYHGVSGVYTGEVATATNKPHGKGQLRWEATGDVYDGGWKHGSRYGYGRMTYAIGDVFEGWFKHDVKEGRGTYQWRDGKQYEGLYVDDKAEDPNGSLSWKNGTLFVGNFSRGQRTGKGVIRFPTNVRYQGDFVRGKYEGFGTCTFQDGRVYTGQWRKGTAHGKGKLTEADGAVLHDGDWANDQPIIE